MTGMSSPHLEQFHTFGAPSRIKNPADREWVEAISGQKIGRLVTVAYMAMLRISTKLRKLMESHKTRWCPWTACRSWRLTTGTLLIWLWRGYVLP